MPNVSSFASDCACNVGFSSEENSISLESMQKSFKKGCGIPMNKLLDEDVSIGRGITRRRPSLVARLMGLDECPSSVIQCNLMDGYCHGTQCKDNLGQYKDPDDLSHRSNYDDQEFKDVFEVMEVSSFTKHKNQSDCRRMLSYGEFETERKQLASKKFNDAKHLSASEVPQKAKKLTKASEVPDSSKDHLVELLQETKSLFINHLHDLNEAAPSSQRNKITILKPSKGAKHWSNEGWSKSSGSLRGYDRYFDMQQEAASSVNMHEKSIDKYFVKDKSTSLSHASFASPHAGRSEAYAAPARIVLLKPNLKDTLFTIQDFRFSSKSSRGIVASRMQELIHKEGKRETSYDNDILSQNDSIELTGEMRRTRHRRRSRAKKDDTSESYAFPILPNMNHQEETCLPSDIFGDWSSSFSSLPLYSPESSVSKEARKRLSERWKITHQFENVDRISRGSRTLGELLAQSDKEILKVTVDVSNTKNVSDKMLTGNESQGPSQDVSSRFLSRSSSIPVSRSFYGSSKLDDRERGSSNNRIRNTNFSKPENVLVKNSRHQTDKCQVIHSVGEENMLPEQEIHVNSEVFRKKIHLRNYVEKRIMHPLPTDYDNTDMNSPKSIAIHGDVAWNLTSQGEATQSVSHVALNNEACDGGIQNERTTEEIPSKHPQVELLPFKTDVAEPHSPSFEELEHSSPVSVLETPSEDETYSSGCFESLSSDLKELRVQIQLLKQESTNIYTEETDVFSEDRDFREDHRSLLPASEKYIGFGDGEERDFKYLYDMLEESGFYGVTASKLFDSCGSLSNYPVDQNVFTKLEKKYYRVASWSRSERKLLFDLINCSLAMLVTSSRNLKPVIASTCRPALIHEGLIDELWRMVVEQKEDLVFNQGKKLLEPELFCSEHGVDLIESGIEDMLKDELLEEVVKELVAE